MKNKVLRFGKCLPRPDGHITITPERIYKIIGENLHCYRIEANDQGHSATYLKEKFEFIYDLDLQMQMDVIKSEIYGLES